MNENETARCRFSDDPYLYCEGEVHDRDDRGAECSAHYGAVIAGINLGHKPQ